MSDESPQPGGDGQVVDGTKEITGFVTYSGDGFAVVRARPERDTARIPSRPPIAGIFATGCPAMYREDDFGMRFVAALESVLDPVVGVLDGLPAHFDPALAPLDILDLATGWLGLAHNEAAACRATARTGAARRRARPAAGDPRRRRARPEAELPGPAAANRGRRTGRLVHRQRAPQASAPAFVVYCDSPISQNEAATVARVIESIKPAHVSYRLRVKGPRKREGES